MIGRRGVIAVGLTLLAAAGLKRAFAQDGNQRPSQDYVTKAAIGDRFEIQSSKLALQRASDDKVKTFASRMVKDHTASSAKMKRIIKAEQLPLTVPAELDDAHRQMIDSLSAANGGAFDHMYLEMQMKAHEEALALHQGYAQSGLEPKLRDFAQKTSAVVQMHLEMLNSQHTM
jgi:putative membrane protein